MRILFDNTIYAVTSAHINAHFFIFKTIEGNSYRLQINNKHNLNEIMNLLLRNGYIELDSLVYVEETPAKLESLDDKDKVKVQH